MHVYECHQPPRSDSQLGILSGIAGEPLAIRVTKEIKQHKKQTNHHHSNYSGIPTLIDHKYEICTFQ